MFPTPCLGLAFALADPTVLFETITRKEEKVSSVLPRPPQKENRAKGKGGGGSCLTGVGRVPEDDSDTPGDKKTANQSNWQ